MKMEMQGYNGIFGKKAKSISLLKQIGIIIDSVTVSKVKWNHFFFFIMSVIFLIVQAIIDILGVV